MKKDWIWMPHPGHFPGGDDCRFKLNTYVNGYIVSTVGEYFPDEVVRRIFLATKISFGRKEGEADLAKRILSLKGDEFNYTYLEAFGYEKIGYDRLYETMVFVAQKSSNVCCPYEAKIGSQLDLGFEGYNTAGDACKGHYEMCEKYDKK